MTAPLLPVFMGQTEIPSEYGPHRYLMAGESARFLDNRYEATAPEKTSAVWQGQEVTRSAFQIQKRLMHLVFQAGGVALDETAGHWRMMEAHAAAGLPGTLRAAEVLTGAGEEALAAEILTRFSRCHLMQALQDAEAFATAHEARLRTAGALNLSPKARVPKQVW